MRGLPDRPRKARPAGARPRPAAPRALGVRTHAAPRRLLPARRARLVIMLKEPRPGRVKTRLAAGIGTVAAAWWFRHQSARLLRAVGNDPRFDTVIAAAPDIAARVSRVWPGHIARIPQGAGDLGARMARIFRTLPPGPVLIIGGDIPGITAQRIARAFRLLGRHDAVIGPASDGGYWLIGLARRSPPPRGLFAGVRWSTAHALADTLVHLGRRNTAFVEMLDDIDTAADLARVTRRPSHARRTP